MAGCEWRAPLYVAWPIILPLRSVAASRCVTGLRVKFYFYRLLLNLSDITITTQYILKLPMYYTNFIVKFFKHKVIYILPSYVQIHTSYWVSIRKCKSSHFIYTYVTRKYPFILTPVYSIYRLLWRFDIRRYQLDHRDIVTYYLLIELVQCLRIIVRYIAFRYVLFYFKSY